MGQNLTKGDLVEIEPLDLKAYYVLDGPYGDKWYELAENQSIYKVMKDTANMSGTLTGMQNFAKRGKGKYFWTTHDYNIIQPKTTNINQLTNKLMDSLRKLPKTLKRVINEDLQKQYRAGLIDGDLEITEKGKRELWMFLQDKFSDELTDAAEEIIEEAKEEE